MALQLRLNDEHLWQYAFTSCCLRCKLHDSCVMRANPVKTECAKTLLLFSFLFATNKATTGNTGIDIG